jgi:hypothetical protein
MGHSSRGYGVPSFRVWCSSACMFFPSNSAGLPYPSMRAAERFEKRQVPSESQPQIASAAESSIRRIRSSLLLCRTSSACLCIALSSERGMVRLRSAPAQNTKKRCYPAGSEYWECAFPEHLGYYYDRCNLTQIAQSPVLDTRIHKISNKRNRKDFVKFCSLSTDSHAIVSRARSLL